MLALVTVAIAFLPQTPTNIERDSRLAQRISVRDAIVSLEDLTLELGKKTGVPLTVKRAFADRKVTVVFREKSAVEGMRMIGTAMLMQWRPTKDGGYQLDLQDRAATEERQTAIFEENGFRRNLRESLEELKQLTKFASEDELRAESDALQAEFKRRYDAKEDPNSPAMRRLGRRGSAMRSLGVVALAKPLAGDIAANEEALIAGRTLFSSTRKDDGIAYLDIENYKRQIEQHFKIEEGIGLVTMDPSRRSLRFDFRFKTDKSSGSGGLGGSWDIDVDEEMPSPLDKRMAIWSKEVSDPTIRETKLAAPTDPTDPGYLIKAYTNAKHLVYLADQANLSVVADAFRTPVSEQKWFPGETVDKWLTAFNGERTAYPFFVKAGYVRTEKGWLMVRRHRWWRELPGEIPERLLLPLEARFKAGQPVGLEECANFVAQLSPPQAQQIAQPSSFLARFRKGGMFASVPALQMYGSLSSAERAIVRGDGFNLGRLSRERQAKVEPFYYAYLATSIDSLEPLRQIFPGRPIPDPQLFFVRDQNFPRDIATQDLDALPVLNQPSAKRKGSRHYEFLLGTSNQKGFRTTMKCD